MYYQKYLKYKNKYLELKKQSGGYATILFHGTSSYYFEHIKAHGLPGKVPEDILQDIETAYDAGYGMRDGYVRDFIQKQHRFDDGIFALSLTGDITVALEYSEHGRKGGEGLSRMSLDLDMNRAILTPELTRIQEKLNKITRYPGIILAVKVNEIYKSNEEGELEIEDDFWVHIEDNIWEHQITFVIPPEKLYLRLPTEELVPIKSEKANTYITTIKQEFEESEAYAAERRQLDKIQAR